MNLEGEEVGGSLAILKAMHSWFCTAYFDIPQSSRRAPWLTGCVLHMKDGNVGISISACVFICYVNYSFP